MSGSNILDVLSKPAAADPDFYNKGLQNLNALRDTQAKQAAADAYRQSLNPDGTVNTPKYNALIASGPGAWNAGPLMEQQGRAAGAQAQASTNQLGFNDLQQTQIAKGFGAMINQPDEAQTPAAYKAQLLQMHADRTLDDSHLAAANAAIDALGPNPDPRAVRLTATRMLITGLSTADIARTALPQTQLVTGPQGTASYVVQPAPPGGPPTGGMYGTPGGFKAGTPPGDVQEYMFQPTDADGKPTGQPYKVIAPKGTVFPSMQGTQITPVEQPATGSGTRTGSGTDAATGTGFPPGYTGRGVPPPPNTNLANPNKPATVPPVTTPPGTTPPATTPPPTVSRPPAGSVATSAPMGTEETLNNDIKARTEASTGARDQRNILQAGEAALEALHLAKGFTGPGTSTTAGMYAFLQAHDPTGALPQGAMTDTAWRQILAKNLLRFAQVNGMRNNTDIGLTKQLEGSANVEEMLPNANEEVLIKDLGRQRQRVAQTHLMPPASTNGDVVNHLKNYSADTDPRGFMWDVLPQPQRDAIEAEAKKDKSGAALERLTKAIHDGIAAGVTKPPSASGTPPAGNNPPASGQTGMTAPSMLMPPTNYATATPNALSAYA